MDKIFEEYKQYCKKHSKKEEGQSKTTLNQYCADVKFVLDCSNSNIEDMYKDEHSFNACFEKYENYVRENNLDEKTLSSYRSDCKNFYKFWQERKNEFSLL